MHALDERIGDDDQLARRGRHDDGAVIADADAHVVALGAETRKVFADELEFTTEPWVQLTERGRNAI